MKYFSLKILIIFFFMSGFSKVFSQEEKLEVYFDINEDGGGFSDTDEILLEFNIKNENDEIIGRVILDSRMDAFQYFNLKNEIVAYQWNHDKVNRKPFDSRKIKSSVRDQKSTGIIFKQKWNPDKERFDIFSKGDNLIGNISLSKKTGLWELYRIENRYSPDRRIFSNYFEMNVTKASNENPSQRRIISGRVIDNNGNPISGATVVITDKIGGAKRGVITDFDGNYSIRAITGEILNIKYVGFKTTKKTILYNTNRFSVVLKPQKTKVVKPQKTKVVKPQKIKNKKLKAKDVRGFGFNIPLYNSDLTPMLAEDLKIRFGFEFHGISNNRNSLGLTFATKRSDTFVSEEYNLTDYDLAVTYGHSLGKLLKLKVGLGYYTYNFNTTESFGAFYDYGGGVYYRAGLQLYIPLGKSGVTLDGFYDNDGLGYGVGFKF